MVKIDPNVGWVEQGLSLTCYVVNPGQAPVEIDGHNKKHLLDGLFEATIKTKPEDARTLLEELATGQSLLLPQLQRPTDEELTSGVRYGVTPIFCAIVTTS